MKKAIFHLGYPKTGTTYLQRKLFLQLTEKYAVVTPEYENMGVTIQRLKDQIQRNEVPGSFEEKIGDRPILFSIEGIIFDPIREFFRSAGKRPSFTKSLEGIRSFAKGYDDDDISFVIYLRAQADLIHSLYAESKTYLFDTQPDIQSLEEYANKIMLPPRDASDAGWYYDFSNTIDEIRHEFPSSEIHVRFHEKLSTDPEGEVAFWSNLTGEALTHESGRENARSQTGGSKIADSPSLHVTIVRLKNKIAPRLKIPNKMKFLLRDAFKKIGRKDAVQVEMRAELRSDITAHFSHINAKLVSRGICIPKDIGAKYSHIEGPN